MDDSRPARLWFTKGVPMRECPARIFLCACCRLQVLVCSHCDRGQIYCPDQCAAATRRALQREAGRRYQQSRAGRFKHAARTRRWRERRCVVAKKVTHQGSPHAPLDVVLPVIATTHPNATTGPHTTGAPFLAITAVPAPNPWRCRWCCTNCVAQVRLGFLRHHREYLTNHGHSP
jgi:hypothetical protein